MPELKLQNSRLDGRYDIFECLGRGSYAEIYVAHDNAASEGAPDTVVIKALNVSLQDAPDTELEQTLVTNFQNEAVALDRVRHPNIISRLGHGTAVDLKGTAFHYIVLEYLSGGDMWALTRKSPLSIEKAVFYLEQVCSGLAYAHKCGVIHRDIKPQNLLLTENHEVVKIADFGVARLEAGDGAITRVGTNIYSAPEHNPLVQTGQLGAGLVISSRDHLTPSADIYSLAKTTYALLAGEPPRRFAQHTITQLPVGISDHYWSKPLLNVLEIATQDNPGDRYQGVQDFWNELFDASLRPTKSLRVDGGVEVPGSKPGAELRFQSDELTQTAPPQPRFELVATDQRSVDESAPIHRPRIVVPVGKPSASSSIASSELARTAPGAFPASVGEAPPLAVVAQTSRGKRFLVAIGLVLAFSGMLLATHKYVTSHWNPGDWVPQLGETFVVGRQGTTTTDVNLRPDASTTNAPVGLAEVGSRVKVLGVDNNWYEIQVLEHGRPKVDPFTSDRGWIIKRYIKFD